MVAAARLLLAVLILFSVVPLSLRRLVEWNRVTIDVIYLLLALVVLAAASRPLVVLGWKSTVHVLDVVFFSAQLFVIPAGTISPAICFLFPVIAACLLFSWKQSLLTTVAMTAAYVAASVYSGAAGTGLEPVALAGTSLVVIAALLIFGRSREEKLENEIGALSSWPIESGSEIPVRALLERTAGVLGVRRLMMTWEEPDEPWLHVAWQFGDEFQWIREAPSKYDPLVVDQLRDTSFVAKHLASESAVLFRSDDSFQEMKLEPLNSSFRRDFSIRDFLSLALAGSTFSGRIFALDDTGLTADDLVFGEIVARFVESRMDHYYLLENAQELGVGQERMRLSRDLHDGVLQSLTGASLQLEAVRAMILSDPDEARRRLSEVQAVIASDQRELRAFIRQLRPSGGSTEADRLAARLSSLSDRYKQQWGVRVAVEMHGMTQLLSDAIRHEVYSIVNEGVANAAKHASAQNVDVRLAVTSDEISIRVKDDGVGFPFTGRFDLEALNESRRGPVSLKERIASLNGALVIDSTPSGSMLEITIPLHWIGPDA